MSALSASGSGSGSGSGAGSGFGSVAGSRARARAAAELLRIRRARQFRPSLYQAYVTVAAVAIYGVLAGRTIAGAVGAGITAAGFAQWGPAVVLVLLLGAGRTGVWQGPVLFSVGDVGVLLRAPIRLGDLARPRLRGALLAGGVLGGLGGVVVVFASAAGFGGLGGVRVGLALAGFLALGGLAVAVSWLVERSRVAAGWVLRGTPVVVVAAVALAVAGAAGGATGRAVAVWSGPWGWAVAPLAGVAAWPLAVGLLAATAVAAVVAGFALAGRVAVERFVVQAEARGQVGAGAFTLDYRAAILARRAAMTAGSGTGLVGPAGVRRRRWIRRPAHRRAAVPWRDSIALVRTGSRVVWASALCAGACLEAIAHAGRALPCAIAAALLYAAASALLESSRVDVDSPDRVTLILGRRYGEVMAAHLIVPVAVLSGVGVVTVVVAGAAGFAGAGPGVLAAAALVVPVVACAVACAALGARRGGRIGSSLLERVLASAASDPSGGVTAIIWLVPWLLAEIVIVGAPLLLAGRYGVAAHPARRTGEAALALVLAAAAAAGLGGQVVRSAPPED